MADIQLTLLGNQRQGQSELVVIRNQPALDGVGYRFPAFIVLIENMPSVHTAVFINHQHGLPEKRQLASARLVVIQQAADGIAEPFRWPVAAVGEQGVELDMQPTVAKLLHRACDFHPGQLRKTSIAAGTWAMLFAQFPHRNSGMFKTTRDPFQMLLQLLRGWHVLTSQRSQTLRLTHDPPCQPLHLFNILFQLVHDSAAFLLARRSVGEVVIASYSFAVAWNWMGTWL